VVAVPRWLSSARLIISPYRPQPLPASSQTILWPLGLWIPTQNLADDTPKEQWLKLDLGRPCFIESVNLQWERAYSQNYMIQVSDSGKTWNTVETFESGNGGEVEESMLDIKVR
jgi:hypothetical protein